MNSTTRNIKRPPEAALNNLSSISPAIASGNLVSIPMVIKMDTPFPIPFSVIFSPNHIKNNVAETIILTDVIVKRKLLSTIAPGARPTYKAI